MTVKDINHLTNFQFKSYRMEFGGVTFTKTIKNLWYSEEQNMFMFKTETKVHRTEAPETYYMEKTDYLDAKSFAAHVALGIWTEVKVTK